MTEVASFSILALTVGLSLARPKLGPLRIHHSSAAVIGALLVLALHLLPWQRAVASLGMLARPLATIVSLMTITLIAEEARLFSSLARWIAVRAGGSGKRLFAYLFFAGTLVGSLFTNDAAVIIFTPLVFNLIDEVGDRRWSPRQKIPFYFSVLYVANVVGALVTSNPINVIVASIFKVSFIEYAAWMAIPALVSVLVSFAGIRMWFRNDIPNAYRVPAATVATGPVDRFRIACSVVLTLVLAGFFSESFTGVPVWLVSVLGALALILVRARFRPGSIVPLLRGVGWDVIVFVAGIFLVARSLNEVGFTRAVSAMLARAVGTDLLSLSFATGLMSAFSSALMNNHPTADAMSWVIRDLGASDFDSKMLALSALIGGDLGPKMLPIGSLAALLWFSILRNHRVHIPYSLYIRLGIPVSLIAVLLSLAMLNIEIWWATT